MVSNYIFKIRKSDINAAHKRYVTCLFDAYSSNDDDDYDDYGRRIGRRSTHLSRFSGQERFPIKFEFKEWYTYSDMIENEKKYSWFSWDELCIPYCAWCYCERSMLEDDNEHEECDMRLYYCSEEGIKEQCDTLAEFTPVLPTIVLGLITSYL